MKRLVSILVAVSMVMVMPMSVFAQGQFEETKGNSGFYFVLDGGLRSFSNEYTVDFSPNPAVAAGAVDYGVNYIVGGGFGYDTGWGFRAEFATSYSVTEGDLGVLGRGHIARLEGHTLNVLAKGIFDLHLPSNKNFVPYAGVVGGYVRFKYDAIDSRSQCCRTVLSDTENHFAYGGLFGFRYSVSERISVGLESSSLVSFDALDPEFSHIFKARVYYSF